jgi:hypothetical protein
LGTRITQGGDVPGRAGGQTLWCDQDRKHRAGLLWDWVELDDGVIAMLDPMCVVTNLRLVNPAGEVLPPPSAALHLMRVVHALPWQDQVAAAIRES